MSTELTAIILVNWNNPRDTVTCLNSLRLLDNLEDVEVFLIDNGSTDSSIRDFLAWAQEAGVALDQTSVPRDRQLGFALQDLTKSRTCLHLVKCADNLYFSGGNNVGLRLAHSLRPFTHFWLLNNDTVVFPDSLTQLLKTFQDDAEVGAAGSTLLYPGSPARIQTLGGARIIPWLATTRLLGNGMILAKPQPSAPSDALDCICGASMLVSRSYLDQVGLVEEGFGMYFEEPDYGIRGRKAGFRLAHSAGSLVIHKEGGTVSPGGRVAPPSVNQIFWLSKSRLLFTWKHYPIFILNALGAVLILACRCLLGGRIQHGIGAMQGITSFLRKASGGPPPFTENAGPSRRQPG